MNATISTDQSAMLNAICGLPDTPWDERKRLLADNAPRLIYSIY